MYGFSSFVVAAMTPAQQMMYLNGGEVDNRTGRSVRKFNSLMEAEAFMREKSSASL